MMRTLTGIALFFTLALMTQAGVVPPLPGIVLPPETIAKLEGTAAEAEDPLALADRISKTTRTVSEKLAERDTGSETLKSQEQIRKDIDALIQALENQPPMGGGGGGGGGQSSPPPMGGGGGSSGSKSSPSGGNPSGKQSGGQRSRSQRGENPQEGKSQPMGGKADGQPMPMGGQPKEGKQGGQPEPRGGDPMPMGADSQPGGGMNQPGSTPGIGGSNAPPTLPLAETVAKEFWGHLPEQPRQRMLQFFREQYMSRYKDLLPQYYSSLAEKEKKNKK